MQVGLSNSVKLNFIKHVQIKFVVGLVFLCFRLFFNTWKFDLVKGLENSQKYEQ